MRNVISIRNTLLAGVIVGLVACSSAGGGGASTAAPAGGGDGVAIQVRNDIVPPTIVTVWLVPETGSRRRLGTITPNGQLTFNFNPGVSTIEYRLVAEATGAQDRSSNPFVLEGVQGLQWDISSVVVRTSR